MPAGVALVAPRCLVLSERRLPIVQGTTALETERLRRVRTSMSGVTAGDLGFRRLFVAR